MEAASHTIHSTDLCDTQSYRPESEAKNHEWRRKARARTAHKSMYSKASLIIPTKSYKTQALIQAQHYSHLFYTSTLHEHLKRRAVASLDP